MVQKEARPRGRPRSFDVDEVLDRARGVFWNLGYAATSLDDLATATGLNRPSLYAAFGDKHALYMAALTRTRDEALGGIGRALSADAPLRATLEGLFKAAGGVYRAGEAGPRGCFIIGTAVTQAVDDPEVRALVADYLKDMDERFSARFAKSASELSPTLTPQTAAPIASALLHTLAVRARAGASEPEMSGIAKTACDLICRPR
jgi:TetR/AcrR family transcriptional regulator, copper-responsive repressor